MQFATGHYEWVASMQYINLDDLDQAEIHAEKGHNILKIVKYDMVGMGLLENIKSRKMAKSSGKSK